MKLRAEARSSDGAAAECLLAVLGRDDDDDDESFARAFAGACLMAEFLRLVREALTKKE